MYSSLLPRLAGRFAIRSARFAALACTLAVAFAGSSPLQAQAPQRETPSPAPESSPAPSASPSSAASPASAANAGDTVQLRDLVVTGTRTSIPHETSGTAIDTISGADLSRRQLYTLSDALGSIPGAPVGITGQLGANTSLFLRGSNSNQTLFLVDGIRLNDPNTDYNLFLGGARLCGCDSLEVAHGPQSTLYGGEAIGGVVSLRAQRGQGTPSGVVSAEAGSFGTVQGALSAQGARDAWAYSVSAAGGHTDNDRANNDFDSATTAARLDYTVNSVVALGATVRGFNGIYGSPGSRFANDPDNEERESNWLGTVFADLKTSEEWTSRVTVGGQSRRFVSENPSPNGSRQITVVKNRRAVLDAQTTYSAVAGHRVTAGLTGEKNHTVNTGFGAIDRRQTLLAVFVQDEFSPVENVFLTAGLRSDDHDTFGRATTGRVSAAWLALPQRLKLRTSYGTAFRSPSFLDLYGQSAFYRGNPNLDPEHARGWDAGLDFYLPEKRGIISATWFETRYRDLIASSPDFSSVINIQSARTRGLELSAKTRLPGAVLLQLAYTYLEAENRSTGRRLLRRPRHSGSADLWHDFGGGFSAGTGVAAMSQREDVNARTFATIDGENFVVARLYGAYAINTSLTLKARVENVLDEKYEQVHGYPQPSASAFGSVEWRF